ncbi:uncharacterized protein LOC124293089 [Neodiprion lecontei]|uniref:Uncharacterized protein LOC124293089 n=1 Tax=Neodiprion lecontei TaxID=441921 RepID=A0ABM3FK37_NEOLC|nr:uncharacterized protein LOC124293089 [Neodiprion lecontei]
MCGDIDSWLKKQPEGRRNKLLYPGNCIKWDGKIGYWRHIIELYLFNPKLSDKLILTEEHVFPTGKTKMRVKFAAQIFSCTVANGLRQMANHKLNEGLINVMEHVKIWETASILEDIDLMFDMTNGSDKPTDPKANTTRKQVTTSSPHDEQWRRYQNIAATKFWFEYSTGKKVNTPTPDALAVTLRSMQGLWEDLQSEGFNQLNSRYLNQDGLENFFGLMRQECGDCHHPTCLHLEAAFKTALVTRFAGTYRPGFNCEAEEKSSMIINLGDLLSQDTNKFHVAYHEVENRCIQAPEISNDNAMFAIEYYEDKNQAASSTSNDCNDSFPPTLHLTDNTDCCEYYFPELENLDEKLESDNFVPLNNCVAADIIGQRLLKKLKNTDCSVCKVLFIDNAEQSGL